MTAGDGFPEYTIRPSDAPAPWAALPAAARSAIDLATVRAAFAGRARLVEQACPDHLRPAAVLVLLYQRDGRAHLVLVKRSMHVGTHRGDLALPGGVLDGEETPEQGALREAWEELGVVPAAVEVIGRLAALPATGSGFRIDTVVALGPSTPSFRPNADEVDDVVEVALADLLDPARYREEVWQAPGGRAAALPFFELPTGGTVWGVTAMILVDLLTILTG